ncbi:RecX family transcriptional regulator [Flavobacterium arcticum]|uniref:Regulatory protein RecX n=1 Tax=Flavobacterium arcticum TaxID=1784713 RepID=A0A345HBC2_9FLAO|nr:regulatory protein RecX [Flavobacterium arcticum]AXG73882.1 RecX family transcriptional regulator [Flavobacterium arcticum]KAF2511833.1 RecX family transcriptional regulator [Flavobacterium arcticum]
MLHKSYTVTEAQKKLEQYCAYQERCHEEVIQKLKSLNMIPQAIDTIIGHLLEHNFLNEERFARSFARGKFRIKHWGKIRIVRELKARQISRYNIDAALKEIDNEEYIAAFNELANKQWDFVRESNLLKKKKKVFDFLMRKGFENQLIYTKIAELAGN